MHVKRIGIAPRTARGMPTKVMMSVGEEETIATSA